MSPNQSTIDTRLKRALMLAAVGIAIPLLAFFVGSQSGGGELSVAQAASSSGQSSKAGGPGGPGGHHNPFDNDEFVEELASALGVDADTLQNALDDTLPTPPTRKEMRAKRAAEQQKLADAIGVSVTDLKAALKEIAPKGGRGRGHGKGGHGNAGAANHTAMERRMARKLAKALDVDVAKVRAALKQAREDREAEMEARHEKFITDLAAALNLDADKVEDALDEVRPAPGRHGEDR
jgi:hypothetical protein